MAIYRVTHPVFVIIRKGGSYLPDALPIGTVISADVTNFDHNTYVSGIWNGTDVLISARDMGKCAEVTSKDE